MRDHDYALDQVPPPGRQRIETGDFVFACFNSVDRRLRRWERTLDRNLRRDRHVLALILNIISAAGPPVDAISLRI